MDFSTSLPIEQSRQVFSYLEIQELSVTALVCRKWKEISEDNILWQQIYHRMDLPEEDCDISWKNKCKELFDLNLLINKYENTSKFRQQIANIIRVYPSDDYTLTLIQFMFGKGRCEAAPVVNIEFSIYNVTHYARYFTQPLSKGVDSQSRHYIVVRNPSIIPIFDIFFRSESNPFTWQYLSVVAGMKYKYIRESVQYFIRDGDLVNVKKFKAMKESLNELIDKKRKKNSARRILREMCERKRYDAAPVVKVKCAVGELLLQSQRKALQKRFKRPLTKGIDKHSVPFVVIQNPWNNSKFYLFSQGQSSSEWVLLEEDEEMISTFPFIKDGVLVFVDEYKLMQRIFKKGYGAGKETNERKKHRHFFTRVLPLIVP